MRSVAKAVSAVLLLAAAAFAQQDIFVPSGNIQPYLVIQRGAAWGSSGIGGVNNNYLFRPISQDESLCVYITNNNPTSSHSVTMTIQQAGDPAVTSFIGNSAKFQALNSVATQPVTVNASATGSFYFRATGSAIMLVQLSGATTQAGSPDTADLFVVQTNQGCGNAANLVNADGQQAVGVTLTTAQQFPIQIGGVQTPKAGSSTVQMFAVGGFGGGFPLDGPNAPSYIGTVNTLGAFHAIGAISGTTETAGILAAVPVTGFGTPTSAQTIEGYVRTNVLEAGTNIADIGPTGMLSFFISTKLTNPATNATVLHNFNPANSGKNYLYKTLIVDCSAACELLVARTTAVGATCTALTPHSMQIYTGSRNTSSSTTEFSCTTPPTASDTFADLTLSNVPFALDLAGLTNSTNVATGAGVFVQVVTGFTGTVTATLEWVELP